MPPAQDVNERQAAFPGRALGFVAVAGEEQTEIRAGITHAVEPVGGFCKAEFARRVGARDDDEIAVHLVAGAARIADFLDEIGGRDRMNLILVIMRALGKKLVLDVDARNACAREFAHRAHRMERLAEARARIGEHRNGDALRGRAGDLHLLGHREKRLGGGA